MKKNGRLILEDGREFPGHFFGSEGDFFGEVCFNTSLTGYQEILSDPSYTGQIVTLTVPHVGNTGVNKFDFESDKYHPSAFIVRELSSRVSNFRSMEDLDSALKKAGIGALTGVSTRELTLHIRDKGVKQGLVTSSSEPIESLVEKIKQHPRLGDEDQVVKVTCDTSYKWNEGLNPEEFAYPNPFEDVKSTFKVAVMDYGVKHNILRMLHAAGCELTVFPALTKSDEILSGNFDGVFLSNGPGDPSRSTYGVQLVKDLLGKLPMFGICLGHQIIGLALGGETFKLKFGHRGGNHPVKDLTTNCVEITSQNHGYALKSDNLSEGTEVTHINLNDNTVEGLKNSKCSVFSVQYHPESCPGPHDSSGLFQDFIAAMSKKMKEES